MAFSALIEDLDSRGNLLDSTLVVCMGEFGRTPKINAMAGRDHWGHVASLVWAGGGVKPGRVIGSDRRPGGLRDRPPRSAPPTWPRRSIKAVGVDPKPPPR